jgi:hypothetical protein
LKLDGHSGHCNFSLRCNDPRITSGGCAEVNLHTTPSALHLTWPPRRHRAIFWTSVKCPRCPRRDCSVSLVGALLLLRWSACGSARETAIVCTGTVRAAPLHTHISCSSTIGHKIIRSYILFTCSLVIRLHGPRPYRCSSLADNAWWPHVDCPHVQAGGSGRSRACIAGALWKLRVAVCHGNSMSATRTAISTLHANGVAHSTKLFVGKKGQGGPLTSCGLQGHLLWIRQANHLYARRFQWF